jgi:Uroporphyrinogen decarboxylase (URO-D)
MKERIDILIPELVLAENDIKKERLERTLNIEATDRTPVVVDTDSITVLGARQVSLGEYMRTPHDHLRQQLLNYKWRCENVRDDQTIETDTLVVEPDFCSLRGAEFPMEIIWREDYPPKSVHLLTEPEQIDSLALPDPAGGLNAKKIEYYRGMQAALDDFDVRLNGNPLKVKVTMSQPGGPIPSAFALCGSNLFLWMKTDPERVHHLMEIVTESHLRCIAYLDSLTKNDPNHFIWVGADAAEMLSLKTFREFAVPYILRLWDRYPPPRIFHMCGRIDHLLDVIRDELKIDRLDGFGFPLDRHLLAEKWSGRLVMRGGPHPLLIHDGPPEAVISECESYIRSAGSKGGYILSVGGGLVPDTPLTHIAAMIKASNNVGSVPPGEAH